MFVISRKQVGPITLKICFLLWASLLLSASSPAVEKFKAFKLQTVDGTAKTLKDFANKATLVAFYYPTCAYCNLAIPEVLKIYDKYKDQGLSWVIINVKPEENKLIEGWQKKYHFAVPVLIGSSQDSLMDTYHLTMTPTHYLLGKKGEVLLHQSGFNTGDEKTIEAKIAEALNAGLETATSEKQ